MAENPLLAAFNQQGGKGATGNPLIDSYEASRPENAQRDILGPSTTDRLTRPVGATERAEIAKRPVVQPEDSWADTGRKFLNRLAPLARQIGSGALQSVVETGGSLNPINLIDPSAEEYASAIAALRAKGKVPGQQAYAAAEKDLSENGYNPGDSAVKKYAAMIAESAVQMVPAVATTLLTRNPELGAAMMGGQVFGQQYGESREAGRTPGQANLDSVYMAAAETIGESIPLGMIMKPGGKFLARTLKTAGAEGLQEGFTQILQTGYDKGVLHPEMTWGEARQQVVDAMIAGAGTGGLISIATAPLARERAETRPEIADITSAAPGAVEAAVAEASQPTQEDIDSPIPTEVITRGRAEVARATATQSVDQALSAAGLPAMGKRVTVDMGNGRTATGKVADLFTHQDADLGAAQGIRVALDDGSTFEEFLSAMSRGGMSVTELPEITPEQVIAGANRQADAALDVVDTPAPIAPRPRRGRAGVDGGIVSYLTANGIGDEVARGVAAGIQAESGGDHTARNPTSGAMGLGQWLGSRQAALRQRYGDNPTREQQLEFLVSELKGGDRGGKAVLQSGTAAEALDNYVRKFMRPAAGAETDGDLARGTATLGGETVAAPTRQTEPTDTAEAEPEETTAERVARITGDSEQDATSSTPNPLAADDSQPVRLGASVVQLTDKSVIVRNTTPEQDAAIKAALPEKVVPLENKRAGGMVYAARHAEKIRAAIDSVTDTRAGAAVGAAPNLGASSATRPQPVSTPAPAAATSADAFQASSPTARPASAEPGDLSDRQERDALIRSTSDVMPEGYSLREQNGSLMVTRADGEMVGNKPLMPVSSIGTVDRRVLNLAMEGAVKQARRDAEAAALREGRTVTAAPVRDRSVAIVMDPAAGTVRTVAAGNQRFEDERAASPKNPMTKEQMPGARTRKEYETQGWNAAESGWSIDDNPYYATSTAATAWDKGFRGSSAVRRGRAPVDTAPAQEQTQQRTSETGGATEPTSTERPAAAPAAVTTSEDTPRAQAGNGAGVMPAATSGGEGGQGARSPVATRSEPATSERQGETSGAQPSAYGADNKLVTRERAEVLRARLREKMRQLNSGIDPEALAMFTELGAFHIEAGARRFTDFAKAIVRDLGVTWQQARPFLRSAYNGARDLLEDSGEPVGGMDGPDQVRIEMAAMFREGGIATTSAGEEASDGLQDGLRDRDAGSGAEAVQQPAEDGRAGRPGAEGERGRAPDGGEPDGQPRQAAERPAAGQRGAGGGRADGNVDADRLPARERDAGRGRRADTGADADQRVTGENWRIEPGALDEARSPAVKARDNVAAIEIVRQLEADGRPATRAEQAALARYVGWGGLKNAFPRADGSFASGFEVVGPRVRELLTDEEYETARRSIQYAHYTSEKVVRPMWDAVRRLGFTGGKVFEPGMGTGNFAGMMPADLAAASQYQGIEFDGITAAIAKALYPQSGISQQDYTRMAMPADAFDLVIGNPPFSETVIRSDPAYKDKGFVLHDFFFAKSLDAVRPGGLLMFVTSAGTLNKTGEKARAYLADRADLVGAVRLPGNAFAENAGTSVTTDIIVLRKRLPGEAAGDRTWVGTTTKSLPNREGQQVQIAVNSWFDSRPEMVLGEQGAFDKLVSGDRYAVRAAPGANVEQDLRAALDRLEPGVMQPWESTTGATAVDFLSTERKNGSFYMGADGRLMQQRGAGGVAVQNRGKGVEGGIPAKDQERIRDLIPVRDALRAVYGHDMAGNVAAGDEARARLNVSYEMFVAKHGPINKATITYQRPSVIQQETARAAAREEARLAGGFFNEGSFDPTALLEANARSSEIAAARRTARETAAALGREFDEGDFDPAEMPDNVIIKRPNIDPFMDDQEAYRLRAIEHYNDDTGVAHKSAVFYENVVTKERPPEINSPGDALLYVLNRTGRVDLDEIGQRSGVSRSAVIDLLGDSVFEVPGSGGSWQTREQYLSGNVRKKLVEAEAEARRDPAFERNVRALEAAQPADLSPAEISAGLGMPWIPTEIIDQFGREALGLTSLRVQYLKGLAQWQVDGDRSSAASVTTWGTGDRSAPLLISDALNRTDPKIYDTVTDVDGKRKQVINPEATQAAQDKVREIKQAFTDWVWKEPERADRLAGIYNRDFNNLVAPEYDGSYLTTPGISSAWSWRPHQKRVVARIIQSGNTYMAHAVGAGKTSAMIGAGMEMRRLGLVRKPAYAVPNHMLGQFTKEFYEQYPTAKIMVADERQFHTDRRKQFVATVANEDLDAVIITHSAFGFIPISDEFADGLIEKQLGDYRAMLEEAKQAGTGDRFTQRRIEQAIESMEQKLAGRGGKRKDQVFTFEETGIDFLFVDEAHLFRKLDFATKMGNVRGVDPNGSQAAFDLYAKTRYLESRTPGRSHVLASGTPITNTMAELYSLSRYQQQEALEERGIAQFDAWAGAYGDTVTALEQDPAGGYKPQTRFAKFVNVPELSAMVRQVMDVVTSQQLEQYVTRPKLKGGKRELVAVDPSAELVEYQETLKRRMAAIQNRKGPPKKGDDILLSVIGDGRKAAIDMRLVDSGIASNEKSKLDVMIDRVIAIGKASRRQPFHKPGLDGYSEKPTDYGPATQMIFSDLGINGDFPIHKHIQGELVRSGEFTKGEVAIISDFKTHVARQRLFNDMNEGKVRVLIGSVAKMGTGVNAQRRLLALHNMDPQWYPANDEQRNGRALRQGNMNPEIEIVDYSTVGTYDSTMWGLMETKARFIEGFMAGDPTLRSMDDLGEASQYEQAKALTTSDPRILQLTEMRQDLERAQRREAAFERQQYDIRRRIDNARNRIDRANERIPQIEADIAQRIEIAGDTFAGTVMGETFDDRAEFGNAVLERMNALAEGGVAARGARVGEVGGFPLVADAMRLEGKMRVSLFLRRNGEGEEAAINSGTAAGISSSVSAVLRKFEGELEQSREAITSGERTVAEFTPQLDRQFEGRGEIDRLSSQVDRLESEIAKDSAAEQAAANAAAAAEAPKESRLSPEAMDVEVDDIIDRDTQAAIRSALEERLRATGLADRALLQAASGLFQNKKVAGSYHMGLIRIALDTSPDPIHTLDHEIIHALKDLGAFRPDEWRALERAAGLDGALMNDIRRRYGELDSEAQIEEAIAEMYANWRRTGEAPTGMVTAAFRRILAFFRALREALMGPSLRGTSESLMARIAAGEIGERRVTDPRITVKSAPKFARVSDYAFGEAIENRFQEARKGVADQRGFVEKTKAWSEAVAQGFTRHFKELPNEARYSDLRQQLRKLEAAPQASRERVVRVLTRMVEGLSREEYDLFSRKVILDDLSFEADEGRDLPFGFTAQTLAGEKAKIDAAAFDNQKVTAAIRLRKLTNDRLADEMVAAEILTKEQVKNPAYYRHQVLEYARLQQAVARTGGAAARLRSPYWARRKGSALDINANLLEAEFDWMQKAFTDIETAKTIEWIKRSEHNIRGDLIRQANDTNRQNVEEAVTRDEKDNGPAGEIVSAFKSFRQRIAIGMSSLRSALEDGTINDVPASLQQAADDIVTGRRGGKPPFALLSWILDNEKPGAMSAASVLKAIGERRLWTKALLGDRYLDPTDIEGLVRRIAPEGYTTWQPEEGKLLFTAKTIPEHIVDGMIAQLTASPGVDGAVFAEVLSKAKSTLVVGGDKYQMVIPQEVAGTLNQMRDPQTESILDEAVQVPLRWWKRWVLINPRRVLKYNINNLSGDLDAVIAGNPRLLLQVGQAAKELATVMRGKAQPSARYQEAVERGVFDSGLSIQEIPDINSLSEFTRLSEQPGLGKVALAPLGAIWRGLQGFTQWRENVFRYAAYLNYVERLERGEDMKSVGYGASIPAMVDAVGDTKDRAALLARDLVGDYGDVSVTGRYLRSRLLPFYSWLEVNTRRYWRLSRNAYGQGLGRGIATSGGLALAAGARRSAWLAIRMAMVFAAINAWNMLFHGDEEDELSDEQRRQLHIILGTWDGEVVTLRTQGALSDALSWFGYADVAGAMHEMEAGRGGYLDVVKAMAKAPVNKVVGGLTPLATQPIAAMTGKSLWPDAFNARPIRDGWRNFFSTFSMENEYDAARGKPTRGYLRSFIDGVTYSRDPGEIAYDESRGLAYDWLKREKGQEGAAGASTPRSAALYDYRRALRYGDEEAADKALATMGDLGMTEGDLSASIKRAAPLGPIAKKDRQAFMDSLTDEEYEKLVKADQWYRSVYL